MNCLHCDSPMPDGASFCPVCGTRAGENSAPALPKFDIDSACSIGIIGADDRISFTLTPAAYLLMFIVLSIPILGPIMALIWAFSKRANPNKKNFAKAVLAFWLIGTALLLSIIFITLLLAALFI
ncbi:MAG: zinc ribbon domain-containing protein [Clostridiales bacterium]|nr:zinc ribbon domain-containing protein [Clostridiales bacterium]